MGGSKASPKVGLAGLGRVVRVGRDKVGALS